MEIDHWLASLRRRATLFAAVLGGSLAIATLLAFLQPASYVAEAEVALAQPAASALLGTTAVAPDVQAELTLAEGSAVRDLADLSAGVSVVVTADEARRTLTFQATADSAEAASAAANAAANAYVELRNERSIQEYQSAIASLDARIAALDARIEEAPAGQARTSLLAQRAAYQDARDRLQIASVVGGTLDAKVIKSSDPADVTSSPHLVRYLAAGLLGGLFLAVGAVAIAEFRDRSIRGPEDASANADGLPVLAELDGAQLSKGSPPRMPVRTAPLSPGAEAYRSLRATIESLAPETPLSLQVTSVANDDGARTTAVNLALAMGSSGQQTILVCLDGVEDLDLPLSRHRRSSSLAALLSGKSTPEDATVSVKGLPNLFVVPGSIVEDPDLLARPSAPLAFAKLRDTADCLIVLAPPVRTSSFALEVGALAGHSILVTQRHSTNQDELREAVHALSLAESRLLGLVLT